MFQLFKLSNNSSFQLPTLDEIGPTSMPFVAKNEK
jgi:hypothetical protein